MAPDVTELRILMLEDTPTDAELAERELRRAGIPFTSLRVDTREAFVRALAEFRPDAVLSDYRLPDFDGLSALKLVRQNHPEIPVIMVTGALSDLEAVELIRAGAKDYVLKDRLARLAPAVERALFMEQGIRARKTAERALRESEEKFRSLVESTSDWIWEVNEQGLFTYASPQVRDILGYTADEVMGKSPFELMAPGYAEKFRETFARIVAERRPFRLLESANLHKNGGNVYMETSGTPLFDAQGIFRGYRGIGRDTTERKRAETESRAATDKFEQSLLQTIEAMAATVEARDPYTAGHQRRVAALARDIAQEMALPEDTIRGLYLAAAIHDLGMVSVPAGILSKPARLSPLEFGLVKTHPGIGCAIIKDVQFPWPIAETILQHHERLDGSGYPRQLKGDQIPLEAKILAVADVVEAMSSHRPYRPALGMGAALREIEMGRSTLYDPAVVDACLGLLREGRSSLGVPPTVPWRG